MGQRLIWRWKGDRTREKGRYGGMLALKSTGFYTQEADMGGTSIIDACNGFNKLIRLTIMWTVRRCWTAGVKFMFNFYKNWEQLLLCQMGSPPVTLLIREGVTQRNPLFVVLYRITLAPLAEDLWAADPGLLTTFYVNDAAFD